MSKERLHANIVRGNLGKKENYLDIYVCVIVTLNKPPVYETFSDLYLMVLGVFVDEVRTVFERRSYSVI